MFENIGGGELLIILFVGLLLFGSKKIPEIAQSFGKGIKEFKKGLKEVENNLKITDNDSSETPKKN